MAEGRRSMDGRLMRIVKMMAQSPSMFSDKLLVPRLVPETSDARDTNVSSSLSLAFEIVQQLRLSVRVWPPVAVQLLREDPNEASSVF